MRRLATIRFLIFLLPVFLLVGCGIFSGQDKKIDTARAEAEAAKEGLKKSESKLSEVVAKARRGEATAADVAEAESEFQKALKLADDKLAALEIAIKEASEKTGSDLSGWGATIGGLFGPVGAAAGGIIGTIGGAYVAWKRGKTLQAALTAVQAGRQEIHAKHPEAAIMLDKAITKNMPASIANAIRLLKDKGVIAELPT